MDREESGRIAVVGGRAVDQNVVARAAGELIAAPPANENVATAAAGEPIADTYAVILARTVGQDEVEYTRDGEGSGFLKPINSVAGINVGSRCRNLTESGRKRDPFSAKP